MKMILALALFPCIAVLIDALEPCNDADYQIERVIEFGRNDDEGNYRFAERGECCSREAGSISQPTENTGLLCVQGLKCSKTLGIPPVKIGKRELGTCMKSDDQLVPHVDQDNTGFSSYYGLDDYYAQRRSYEHKAIEQGSTDGSYQSAGEDTLTLASSAPPSPKAPVAEEKEDHASEGKHTPPATAPPSPGAQAAVDNENIPADVSGGSPASDHLKATQHDQFPTDVSDTDSEGENAVENVNVADAEIEQEDPPQNDMQLVTVDAPSTSAAQDNPDAGKGNKIKGQLQKMKKATVSQLKRAVSGAHLKRAVSKIKSIKKH